MKIWVDDIRSAPSGYVWCKSVCEVKRVIINQEAMLNASGGKSSYRIEFLDIDHDAGDQAVEGGDYINILCWLEETNRNYPIHIHSMNPVGVENMRRIIKRNNWEEI